jgi:Virulence protein
MSAEDQGEIIIYQSEDGNVQLDVRLENETVWLTIDQMALLFGKARSTINEHILNAFQEGELNETASVRKIGNSDFSTKPTIFYNLDVIISVGYRVHSIVGTRFRQWATARLHEYIVKGFTLDDRRLKGNGGGLYWKELLDRIRDIRSSEKVLYRQVLDLYATSVDYNPKAEESVRFFKSSRTSCIMLLMGTLRLRLYLKEPMRTNLSWD